MHVHARVSLSRALITVK